ncbi:MAG: glucose-6-phosphate isomerase [Bacteroidales bacterium]|nr:glucose-6-phosphate isomerase [Bacteroidales bacterium]MCF8399133.1 glucose-6-phosphate isomerase [Bacteroidales bacterium]
MANLKLDIRNVLSFIDEEVILSYQEEIEKHFEALYDRSGKGNDFLGWMDLPTGISKERIDDINATAERIRDMAEVFVVIGIGGSYLGARAVIEALGHHFYELKKEKDYPLVIFAGQNISEDYLANLLEILDEKDYAVSVISKSGTTTEPAIAFRLIREHMEKKYGVEEARKRIIAITDKEKGALRTLADNEGYKTYVVPDDVGGRYSVLTPVGLLPIAMAGFDIEKLLQGAESMKNEIAESTDIKENPVALYAATRNALYQKDKIIEILVNYQPELYYFTEWWKQLYGESEGKEGKGIFPAGVSFTTDLHSMGQYIQDGLRKIFETVISVENPNKKLQIPKDEENLDKLNYIAGKRIHEVNLMAEKGTTIAHVDGGVPNIKISIPQVNEKSLGELIFFFEMACALSGYILGINPFDQPGVEEYKRNMFALLGKPGFEKETEKIRKRL